MSAFQGILRLIESHLPDLRRHGRVPVERSLRCSLGTVADCSRSGLRVRTRRPVRPERVDIRLWDDLGGFRCEVVVIWRRREGFFRHECGLLLPPLEGEDLAEYLRLVERHRDLRSFAAREAA